MTPDRTPSDRSPADRSPADRSAREVDADPAPLERSTETLPFDGTVIVQAGTLASVPLSRLPAILRPLQSRLADRIDDYRREHERVLREPDREVFLVDLDHWRSLADGLGLGERPREAARRTHETQLERSGSVHDRRAEFEAALEIRSAVVIGTDDTTE
ncbi:hypothetical protein [Halopenitus persicus]|uniref:hypothetical protein n=1 Tax=Halopenitus persicus TaxID=1048396 RepID=UPI001E54A90C|nr:hypothetical protein [Halopenitus persicus]